VAEFLAAHRDGVPVALTTSGTSAGPRAVVRTTRSWVGSFPAVERLTGLDGSSRLWLPGPLTSTMNLFAAVHAATLGAPLVATPAEASHAVLTPAALVTLLDDGAPAGLTVVVAGDRLSRTLHDRAVADGLVVHHYYGAAELSFVAWGEHADDLTPFPGVEVVVRDGEVLVRTPYVCLGYDGPPGPLRTDPDGFATVGDRGVLSDGRLLVAGRTDAVTVGGATVEPADVEVVLREAATGEVVVVALPHPTLGRVLGVVLTAAGDLHAVRKAAREHLDGARRPRLWFRLSPLPLTAAGKVDRAAVFSLVSGADGRPRRLV
jgi:acyl-coenzyme A synthetase/AMP-(fatty) acid ligase